MGFFILSYGYMENRVPNDSDKKKDNSNNTKEQQQKNIPHVFAYRDRNQFY